MSTFIRIEDCIIRLVQPDHIQEINVQRRRKTAIIWIEYQEGKTVPFWDGPIPEVERILDALHAALNKLNIIVDA